MRAYAHIRVTRAGGLKIKGIKAQIYVYNGQIAKYNKYMNTIIRQIFDLGRGIGSVCMGLRTTHYAPRPGCAVHGSYACAPAPGCGSHGPTYTGTRTPVPRTRTWTAHLGVRTYAQGRATSSNRFCTKYHGIIRRIGVPGAFFVVTYMATLSSLDNFFRTCKFSRGKFPGIFLTEPMGVQYAG